MVNDRKTPNLDALKDLHGYVEQSLNRKLPKSVIDDIANAPEKPEPKQSEDLKKNEKAAKDRQHDVEA